MKKILIFPALLMLATTSVLAHHSAAVYVQGKKVTTSGTVKKWQWTNPHAFLWLVVDDGKHGTAVAGFELGSPNTLVRNGFRATTFKPGDKATVLYSPRRDGQPGGALGTVYSEKENKWFIWGPAADAKAAQEAAEARAKKNNAAK